MNMTERREYMKSYLWITLLSAALLFPSAIWAQKTAEEAVSLGRVALTEGRMDEAQTYLQKALRKNNKYAPAYVLAGDIDLKEDKVGEACSNYEQAIYFDASCQEAYLKYAHTYAGVNPALSVEMLLKLKAQDPSYLPVERELASLYYAQGEYGKAREAYENYFGGGGSDEKDLVNYGMVLFLAKDYARSLDIVKRALLKDPENHVLKRLMMYNNYELKQTKEGLAAADLFFEDPQNPDYVYLDYLYHARLLDIAGQADQAVLQYEEALRADSSRIEIWKELAEVYEKQQNYEKAIGAFDHFFKAQPAQPEVADLFLLGRLYYFAGSGAANLPDHRVRQKELLMQADSLFAEVARKTPENYLGNFWRARTNSLLDPETTEGLAKPYYEAALTILENKPDASKSLLIECNSYLGYYYFVKNDFAVSKQYWNKILGIDPSNETAKKALDGLK